MSYEVTSFPSLLQVNRVDATTCKEGEEGEPLRGRGDEEEGSPRGSLEDLQRATSPTMLLSHTSDHDGYDTRYAKSFRHFTREALPRLDNYRNIMSIQAAYRPTLDELHNATLQAKVGPLLLIMYISHGLTELGPVTHSYLFSWSSMFLSVTLMQTSLSDMIFYNFQYVRT
jgi:hypothetical protein